MRPPLLPVLVPVAAALGLAATAASAGASTLCVGSQPAGVSCTAQYPFTGAGLTSAFADAHANNPTGDTVRVAAGALTGLSALTLDGVADSLVGAGLAETTLEFSGGSGALLTLGSNGSTTIQDLTVQSSLFTANGTVLSLGNGGLAERVRVKERTPANVAGVRAIYLGTNATVRRSEIDINSNQDVGVTLSSSSAVIEDSAISGGGTGYAGVQASSSSGVLQMRRLHISGVSVGIVTDAGAFNLDDSVIELGAAANAVGIRGVNYNASTTTISAQIRRSTIVGSGPNQTGVLDNADNAGETVNTIIRDSLLRVTGAGAKDIHCGDVGLVGTSSLTTLNTGFGTLAVHAPTCPHTSTADANLAATPPTFVNAAAGDYRPTWNSSAVDRGTGAAPGATTDIAGGVRLIDADGIGGAFVDLGAYEYQHLAPLAPSTTSIPTTGSIGESLAFGVSTATDPDGDPIVEYAWDFGDGTTATGATPAHGYASGGDYTVTVRAKDVTGLIGAPASATVTVPAAATQAPTPTPGGAPTPTTGPTSAPTVRLVTTPTRALKRGKTGFVAATKASGATATLTVTGATKLRLTVARVAAGRKTAKGCSRIATRGKRCSLRVTLKGSAALAVRSGTTNLAFGGTFAGKRLPAGEYAVTVAALGASNVASAPITYRVTLR